LAFNIFLRVSKLPTNPLAPPKQREFDVAELFDGPISVNAAKAGEAPDLDEKLCQAYFWIDNNAIIGSNYDIGFNDGTPKRFAIGDCRRALKLPSSQSDLLLRIESNVKPEEVRRRLKFFCSQFELFEEAGDQFELPH
jgi:hypothetical protein